MVTGKSYKKNDTLARQTYEATDLKCGMHTQLDCESNMGYHRGLFRKIAREGGGGGGGGRNSCLQGGAYMCQCICM